jgi:hypothetical protein
MGNLTIDAGTLNFGSTGTPGHSIKGNIVVAPGATLNFSPATAGTINLNGSSPQSITNSGTFSSNSFETFAINNSSGVSLGSNLTVGNATAGGGISFTSGKVSTGVNTLTLGSGASISGAASGTGYVNGNLQKAVSGAATVGFDVGTASDYSPVSVNFTSVGGAGSLTATAAAPISAPVTASGLSATKYVNRSWTLTNGGITSPAYSATFSFAPTDLQGGANTSNLIVAKNTSGTWSNPSVGTRTSTSTQATGLTAFSDFELGEAGCPTITLAPAAGALPGATTGSAYSQAISSSGGATPVTYAVTSGSLPAGLSLAGGGALTGTPTAAGNASFTVTATDANGCTGNAAYTLAVTCPTITVAPAAGALPGGNTSAAYSQTISASGGTSPYTFAVTAGSVPTGLTLATGGAISGTPTALGNASFTVTATDANGCTGSAAYTVNVTCGAIAVAPGSLPNGTQNSAYSQTITASGGTGPYTFAVTSGTLPAGLTLAAGGALTGTPTGTGTSNFDVTATDANACTGVQSYALTIDPAAVNTVSPVSATACVTPAHPCQTVPVNIARGDATGMRLFHVTFQLSANLQLCSTPGASVTEGAYLSAANPNTTFLVTPNGGGS